MPRSALAVAFKPRPRAPRAWARCPPWTRVRLPRPASPAGQECHSTNRVGCRSARGFGTARERAPWRSHHRGRSMEKTDDGVAPTDAHGEAATPTDAWGDATPADATTDADESYR